METIHFARNPYNYDADYASETTGQLNEEPSVTQQQFKEECDINTIARNFGVTGHIPLPVYMPTYGDFTDVGDFQSALHAIQRAEASFMAMPSEVRARFENSPQKFLDFTSDVRNADEARALGLFRDAAPAPIPQPSSTLPTPVTPAPTA